MKKQQPKIKSLQDKIYLLTLEKPIYKAQISECLYGEGVHKKTIYPEIEKLLKQKWIKEVKNYSDPEDKEKDGRSWKRTYLYGSSTPILNSILKGLEKENIQLTKNEKSRLIKFLDTNTFRKMFTNRVTAPALTIELVTEFLSIWCIYFDSVLDLTSSVFGVGSDVKGMGMSDWGILGKPLIKKLANLQTYRTDMLRQVFDNMERVFGHILDYAVKEKEVKEINLWD